jgi:hypothetical protein
MRAALDRFDDLGKHLTEVSTSLRESVDKFVKTTDASTARLATWTKVLASDLTESVACPLGGPRIARRRPTRGDRRRNRTGVPLTRVARS